jgi:hypothetical protein
MMYDVLSVSTYVSFYISLALFWITTGTLLPAGLKNALTAQTHGHWVGTALGTLILIP